MRTLARSLLAGVVWMVVVFLVDSLDASSFLLDRLGEVQAEGEDQRMITAVVTSYIGRVAVGHVVMGLIAGVLLHLVMGIWTRDPLPARRFWVEAALLAGLASALGLARVALTLPPLFGGLKYLPHWVDLFTPPAFAVVQISVAAALIGWRFVLWGRGEPGRFARRLLALTAALGVVAMLDRNPQPTPPRPDNPARQAGLNIVLLGIDGLRPDRLSGLGHDRATSPNIDALLAESVHFSSAWTPVARTYPAWTSLLTGSWPTRTGVRDNLPPPERLIPNLPTLSGLLQGQGLHTAFVTDDSRFSFMVPELGWDQIYQPPVGLMNFVMAANEPPYRVFNAFAHNPLGFRLLPVLRHNQAFGKTYRPGLFADRSVDQLSQAAEQGPFLYAIHSCALHYPGDRIWPYTRMFGQEGFKRRNRFRYANSPTSFQPGAEGSDEPDGTPQALAAQDERIYDTGVYMADELVGQLMQALRDGGLLENTVVVLFSDHGEELWAPDLPYNYGGPNHGFHLLGSAQNKVVLAIRLPDGPRGMVIDDPVRLIDIAPTIAELTGTTWPAEIDGRSLMPLVRGEREERPRLVYMETGVSEARYWVSGHRTYPFARIHDRYGIDVTTGQAYTREEFVPHLIAAKDRAVQVGRWKLVWHAVENGLNTGLYDIVEDPHQRNNLARRQSVRVAWLGAQLLDFLEADGEDPDVAAWWRSVAAGVDEGQMLGEDGATEDR